MEVVYYKYIQCATQSVHDELKVFFSRVKMAQFVRNVLLSPTSRINRFMMQYPKQTSVGATCLKTLGADLLVQIMIDKNSINNIDWTRAAVFGTFGFFYLGIFQYWLYNTKYFKWFPGVSFKSTIQKVALDQFIKHPVLYWPTFYFLQTSLNERKMDIQTIKSAGNIYKTNIVSDMKAMWTVWIPTQCITFGLMPLHLRLPFIASVSFFWCCLLSFMHGKYDKDLQIDQELQIY